MRRATKISENRCKQTFYFYPRSPCGERQVAKRTTAIRPLISIHALLAESDGQDRGAYFIERLISIHALLAESDDRQRKRHSHALDFYPRSPCGERPPQDRPVGRRQISIHALLAESDNEWYRLLPVRDYFYPRSPCGERRLAHDTYVIMEAFLSTLSLRRATVCVRSR